MKIRGTNWGDYLEGTSKADVIYAGGGYDTIDGRGGDDVIYGSNRSDWSYAANRIYVSAGNDIFYGGNKYNILEFDNVGDRMRLSITGDKIKFTSSTINGTIEVHHVDELNLEAHKVSLHIPEGNFFARFRLSPYDDRIISKSAITIDDIGGDNYFRTSRYDETISVSLGDDTIYSGGGDDVIRLGSIEGKDFVDAGSGSDIVQVDGSAGTLFGGTGEDVLEFGNVYGSRGVTVDLTKTSMNFGSSSHRTLVLHDFEHIRGSEFDDRLYGDDKHNMLFGDHGYDTLIGRGGDDNLDGYDGDDVLIGGEGDDTFRVDEADTAMGGNGDDIFFLSYGDATIDGGKGFDILDYSASQLKSISLSTRSGASIYVKRSESIEGVFGSIFDNKITGNAKNNYLAGNDGRDVLKGEDGDDLLTGGEGDDTLTGGQGHDVFLFKNHREHGVDIIGQDRIVDFNDGVDKLAFAGRNEYDLSRGIENFDTLKSGKDTVEFDTKTFRTLVSSQFSQQDDAIAHSAAVRIIYDRVDGLVYYDADGSGKKEAAILVADIGKDLTLSAADILVL